MPRAWFILLLLAVWTTCTPDHVLDGFRYRAAVAAPRHYITRRYTGALVIMIILAIAPLCVSESPTLDKPPAPTPRPTIGHPSCNLRMSLLSLTWLGHQA